MDSGDVLSGSIELVWAKQKYCSFWPARIVQPPPELGKPPRRKVCVFFFGTDNFGFVEMDNIKSYQPNRSKFVAKGRGADFKTAVQKIDEFLMDPVTYRSNICTKPVNNQICVKTECDFVIKDEQMFICEQIDFNIDSVVKLQQQVQSIREKNKELMSAKIESDRRLVQHQRKIELLNKQNAESKVKIDRLIRENNMLTARVNQFKRGFAEQQNQCEFKENRSTVNEENANVYEVERILLHKKDKNGTDKFLVRWKGYSSQFDSWERKQNLNCPKLLDEYFMSLKLH